MKVRIYIYTSLLVIFPFFAKAQTDTLFAGTKEIKKHIDWNYPYHQTLTMKIFLAQSHFDGKYKRRDNGKSTVYLTFEEALEVIKKIDKLSLGIPKVIYVVGWQYNGHDSKYPAFFEGNKLLKRQEDENALESLKWLMREASKYNTTVSVHITMFDAYEDSPLWDTYVENDIIAKNKDGSLREGEWGYPISYAQEWKTGYAQKRIDSLCAILPIEAAGTVHIDAFHTWAPVGKDGPGKRPFIKEPVSPYLGFSIKDETEAQKKIFKYWASKGIDVTSEGSTFLREDSFVGYQPYAWWVDWTLQDYMDWPASLYTGGTDNRDLGKLFGTSIHGEDIVMKDHENLHGFKRDFCTRTLVWYYLNRLDRKYYIKKGQKSMVQFSDGVESVLDNGKLTITKGDFMLVEDGDVFVPALWMQDKTIIAYSEMGYKSKTWQLPDSWKSAKEIEIAEVTINGLKKLDAAKVKNGYITLDLEADQMLVISVNK